MDRIDPPDLPAPPFGHVWVNSTLMTTEQVRVEGWTQDRFGNWRAGTVDQLRGWGRLQRDRKDAKRANWQRGMDADEDFRRLYAAELEQAK